MDAGKTLRFDSAPDPVTRGAVEEVVARGGTVEWRNDVPTGRTYVLARGSDSVIAAETATVYPGPIIALAVRPNPAEALPALLHAFGGEGRPRGVVACERVGSELCIEWLPQITSAALVRALLRSEVARFGGSYVARSLAPLPVEVVTSIAAEGLLAPEIAPDRVLDLLVSHAYGIS
jgi:hypothetical protein